MKKEKTIHLEEITDPHCLATLSYNQLENLAIEIRNKIIDATSINGGHLSSNLGATDLTISLHRNFDFKNDKLLFDVGHQCYAHKLLTGRSLEHLRKKDGVAGFIKSSESIYDVFEAGHSSTSLSAAAAYALDRDNKGEKYEVVALIGDASLANGVALEALNLIPSSDHKVIIVLNDNGMSISRPPISILSNFFRKFQTSVHYDRLKKLFKKVFIVIKPFYTLASKFKYWMKRHLIATNLFDNLGFIYIGVVDGHSFKQLDRAFKKAKKIHKSVVIHVRTKKGKGYKFAENDEEGSWHGVSPYNKKTGLPINIDPEKICWSALYGEFILERLASDGKFYLICPGTLMGSHLAKAIKEYPDRVIDTGISEEHAFILGANLAKLGYHVCISVYSTFMQRSFDQISHDLARIHAPVTVLVDRAGLVGEDGDTHQGLYDESFLMATPNIGVAMATNPNEAYQLFNRSYTNKEAIFIRYPRDSVKKVQIDRDFKLKEFNIIKKSSTELALVSVGPLTSNLLEETVGLDVSIYNPIILKPISRTLIKELLTYQKIVIYTPYETSNGFALNLLQALNENGFKGDVYIKAVPLKFVEHAEINEQLEELNLTPKQIRVFLNGLQNKKH